MAATLVDNILRALAMAGGQFSLADVMQSIESGEARVWERNESVIITTIEQYPRKRELRVWIAAGNVEDIAALADDPDLYEYAQSKDVDTVTILGRRGWKPFLAARGFESELVEYRKEM